jgi:hypothetical protein
MRSKKGADYYGVLFMQFQWSNMKIKKIMIGS